MIKVTYGRTGKSFWVKALGHAAYDKGGKDIICAAVSILFYSLYYTLEERGDVPMTCSLVPGDAHIKAEGNLDGVDSGISMFLCGLEMLADVYPKNISLERK